MSPSGSCFFRFCLFKSDSLTHKTRPSNSTQIMASKRSDSHIDNTQPSNSTQSKDPLSIRKCFMTLIDHKGKDKPKEYRDYHLVVATLIAAVTFQAGVNPPGGVWQDNSKPYESKHEAGRAVYASDPTAFYVFLTFNTLALSASMLLIFCLTWGYPFFLEVMIAMVSMGITYGASIFAITPKDLGKFRSLLSTAAVPAIVRGVILIYKYIVSKSKNPEGENSTKPESEETRTNPESGEKKCEP